MKTTEGLGDVVVIHALDPGDASAIIPMRAAARTQKGTPWRIESRKFYDALMEGVSPIVTLKVSVAGGDPQSST